MWTYIKKNNLESYLYHYPFVAENFNDICLYQQDEKLFLPRYFCQNYPDGLEYIKLKSDPMPTYYKFIGKLRPEQIDIVNTILGGFQRQGYINGIIKARPGLG